MNTFPFSVMSVASLVIMVQIAMLGEEVLELLFFIVINTTLSSEHYLHVIINLSAYMMMMVMGIA
jgi:hypothetical protein